MKSALTVLLIFLFGILTYHVAGLWGEPSPFGFEYRGAEVSLSTFALIAIPTVVGAMLGSIYRFIDVSKQHDDPWWKLVWLAIRAPRFALSLLATPLIVFSVFSQVDVKHVDFGIALFCGQSGFFWERTLAALGKASA